MPWRFAGVWMVFAAIGLAAIGIVLAIQQSVAVSQEFDNQLRERAAELTHYVQSSLQQNMRHLAQQASTSLNQAESNTQSDRIGLVDLSPAWLQDAQACTSNRCISFDRLTNDQPNDLSSDLSKSIVRLRIGMKTACVKKDIRDTFMTVLPFDDESSGESWSWAVYTIGDRPIAIGGIFDVDLLKVDLVDPLLTDITGLELTPTDSKILPWHLPLPGPLKTWSVKPAASLVTKHGRMINLLTLFQLALTVLAVGTILAAMWMLIRLTQRDMALATMKSNFVADVSHELKTPLAVIRLYGETLQSGKIKDADKLNDYYDIITREATRLSNLIENILDFARIESGRKVYMLEPSDVAIVVRETYEAYVPEFQRCSFTHKCDIEDNLPRVNADHGAIAQVLFNLMSNVIKYSNDDRAIEIEVTRDTRRNERGVLISVHDHGIGIAPEDRAHLFDGFYRSADSRVRLQRGTGLGLAVVKSIVDVHLGTVWAESRLVKGTTFRVFLPAADAE